MDLGIGVFDKKYRTISNSNSMMPEKRILKKSAWCAVRASMRYNLLIFLRVVYAEHMSESTMMFHLCKHFGNKNKKYKYGHNRHGKSPPIGNAERSHPNGDSLERIEFLIQKISYFLCKATIIVLTINI